MVSPVLRKFVIFLKDPAGQQEDYPAFSRLASFICITKPVVAKNHGEA